MSKKERYIEVQKGPVRCDETYSLAFYKEEPTRQDLEYNAMRRSGMTLTKHEPRRLGSQPLPRGDGITMDGATWGNSRDALNRFTNFLTSLFMETSWQDANMSRKSPAREG